MNQLGTILASTQLGTILASTQLGTILASTQLGTILASTPLGTTLAWTPLLQPAPGAQHWWWLLVVPMALGVAMAYKAIRVVNLADWPKAVAKMTLQIVAAMLGIAVGLYLLVIVLLPMLPAE